MSLIKNNLRKDGILISSDKQVEELLTEFILDRAIGGLKENIVETLTLFKKKTLTADLLKLALKATK